MSLQGGRLLAKTTLIKWGSCCHLMCIKKSHKLQEAINLTARIGTIPTGLKAFATIPPLSCGLQSFDRYQL